MQYVNNREVVLQMITEIIFITAPAIVLQVDPTGGSIHPSGMSCPFHHLSHSAVCLVDFKELAFFCLGLLDSTWMYV